MNGHLPEGKHQYDCFSDPKYFYREFRKKHGHTPHQHRIWYKSYNRQVSDDITYTLEEKRLELEHYIASFFCDMLCGSKQ